jgi:hypothetical protein
MTELADMSMCSDWESKHKDCQEQTCLTFSQTGNCCGHPKMKPVEFLINELFARVFSDIDNTSNIFMVGTLVKLKTKSVLYPNAEYGIVVEVGVSAGVKYTLCCIEDNGQYGVTQWWPEERLELIAQPTTQTILIASYITAYDTLLKATQLTSIDDEE